jgi:hypothetical protein
VLEIWVDTYVAATDDGETEWKPGHEGSVFDVDRWLPLALKLLRELPGNRFDGIALR